MNKLARRIEVLETREKHFDNAVRIEGNNIMTTFKKASKEACFLFEIDAVVYNYRKDSAILKRMHEELEIIRMQLTELRSIQDIVKDLEKLKANLQEYYHLTQADCKSDPRTMERIEILQNEIIEELDK